MLAFLGWFEELDQATIRDDVFWTNSRLADRFLLESGLGA